jgi:hypothetical protein
MSKNREKWGIDVVSPLGESAQVQSSRKASFVFNFSPMGIDLMNDR